MSIDLSTDGIDWDPYGTWDPAEATDESDGRPDVAIIPLVEHLRDKGVVTLQSCAGHLGNSDGVLWVAASTVSERSVRKAVGSGLFERVQRVIHPWQQWELWWLPQNFDEVETVLRMLEPRLHAFERSPGPVSVNIVEPSPQRQMIPVPVPYCPRCGGSASAMRI